MKFILDHDDSPEPDSPGIVVSPRRDHVMYMCAMENVDCDGCGSFYCGQCQRGESPWTMGYQTDIIEHSGRYGLVLSDISETIDEDSDSGLPFNGAIKTNITLSVRDHRGRELTTSCMVMGRYEAHAAIYLALRNKLKSDTTLERRKRKK